MYVRRCVVTAVAILALSACAATGASLTPAASQRGAAEPVAVTIYRTPDCSCCHVWAGIARQKGWAVATVDKVDMVAFKAAAGVPTQYSSCHTTVVAGYFVEGHVPLEAVDRLLTDKPDIDGIALPGMPAGSPGMGGVQEAPFEVVAITDGVATPFGSY